MSPVRARQIVMSNVPNFRTCQDFYRSFSDGVTSVKPGQDADYQLTEQEQQEKLYASHFAEQVVKLYFYRGCTCQKLRKRFSEASTRCRNRFSYFSYLMCAIYGTLNVAQKYHTYRTWRSTIGSFYRGSRFTHIDWQRPEMEVMVYFSESLNVHVWRS